MRKFVVSIVFCLGALLVAAVPAAAAEAKQDFVVVNKTGYDIKELYVSPSKSDDWQEDVLGEDLLSDGDSWNIKFTRATRTCKWDLKVVYSGDDSTAVWNNIDLCAIARVTIKYNKKSDTTSAVFD
jgi:hypothetical protein